MNFRRGQGRDEVEINLIPMIDVLLVILIFVLVTSTVQRFGGFTLQLPVAGVTLAPDSSHRALLEIAADGRWALDGRLLGGNGVSPQTALTQALGDPKRSKTALVISADQAVSHGVVMGALDAARQAGIVHVTLRARPAH